MPAYVDCQGVPASVRYLPLWARRAGFVGFRPRPLRRGLIFFVAPARRGAVARPVTKSIQYWVGYMNDNGFVSSELPATMKPRIAIVRSTTGAPLEPLRTTASRAARSSTRPIGSMSLDTAIAVVVAPVLTPVFSPAATTTWITSPESTAE